MVVQKFVFLCHIPNRGTLWDNNQCCGLVIDTNYLTRRLPTWSSKNFQVSMYFVDVAQCFCSQFGYVPRKCHIPNSLYFVNLDIVDDGNGYICLISPKTSYISCWRVWIPHYVEQEEVNVTMSHTQQVSHTQQFFLKANNFWKYHYWVMKSNVFYCYQIN